MAYINWDNSSYSKFPYTKVTDSILMKILQDLPMCDEYFCQPEFKCQLFKDHEDMHQYTDSKTKVYLLF